MRKQILLFFATAGLLAISFNSLAQTETELTHTAPSLQIGLEGLNFSRGTLDAQLIMQIVAEKQKEVGLKVVQNMFLKKMSQSGGAFYSFTDNIVRGIVSESDINVITKKLLENTVNITFTYAFADYYLKTLKASDLVAFNALANSSSINATGGKLYSIEEINTGIKAIKNRVVSISGSDSISNNPKQTKLIALLMDMSNEAIRKNSVLKDLGIMQVSYSQSYEYLNKYLDIMSNKPDDSGFAGIVYRDMQSKLSVFTNMIGLLHYHTNSNSYRLNNSKIFQDFNSSLSITSLSGSGNSLVSELQSISMNLLTATENLQKSLDKSTDSFKIRNLIISIKALQDDNEYILKAKSYYEVSERTIGGTTELVTNTDDILVNSDIIYTLYSVIIPNLKNAGVWNIDASKEAQNIDEVCKFIHSKFKPYLISVLNYSGNTINNESFLKILSTAYQFDKANTFSNSVKMLSDLENVFPNEKIKDALAFMNTYIRDFVAIYKDKNGKEFIDLNVESLLSKLSTVKADRLRRFGILFTVGVNSNYFNKPLKLESSESIRNFSFVSEKIGLKIKLKDNSFWKTRNYGETYSIDGRVYKKIGPPTEPAISDIHYIIYASGILYNIVNTGTSGNFNYPLVANGIGLTFFNSLDVNLTYGIPILKNATLQESCDFSFVGLSFDFPYTEYIHRLNENRKDNKNKKLIAEAVKN